MHINLEHKQELLNSKIHPDVIALNFFSLAGDLPFEYVLSGLSREDRRNDGRLRDFWLKRYQHLSDGGWWCSGYDVITKQKANWGCFKPDNPLVSNNGRLIKYEHPPKVPTEIFTLFVPDKIWQTIAGTVGIPIRGENFWDWVIDNPQIPLVITEGAKKAGALLSAGYAAIALPGINNACREDGKLIPHLSLLCQKGREVTFAFDCDSKWKTVQAVNKAIFKIGKILTDSGCDVYVAQWRTTDGKGVDDLIASQGIETWHRVYDRRVTLAKYEKANKEKPLKMDFDGLLKFLDVEFNNRLTFDELKHQIVLDGEVLTLANELRCWICEKYNIKTTKEALNDALIYQAQKNSFHPVKRYLEKVGREVKPVAIDLLASRYFGTEDPLYDIFLKRWLIGAVARIFKPECKMDHALILQGKQGVGKSTFFNVLGGEWFSDSLGDINSKDALQTLHKFWIHELGEFERITSKKAAGEVKIFLSKTRDDFRIPYGREIQEHPRMCIICGSVNQSSFLVDETGNRRFWIIPIETEQIELETLRRERDAIWSGAVQAYQKGEAYELTYQEKQLCLANNDRFEMIDEWQAEVEHYIEHRQQVSISEILLKVFGIEIANQDKSTQLRIASILTRLNWYKAGRKQHLGRKQVIWEPRDSQQASPVKNQNFKKVIDSVSSVSSVSSDRKMDTVHTRTHLSEDFSNFSPLSKGTWGDKPRYVHPPNAFKPGERVVHEDVVYKVLASTHTHVLLEGFDKSIPIWQVERLEQ